MTPPPRPTKKDPLFQSAIFEPAESSKDMQLQSKALKKTTKMEYDE